MFRPADQPDGQAVGEKGNADGVDDHLSTWLASAQQQAWPGGLAAPLMPRPRVWGRRPIDEAEAVWQAANDLSGQLRFPAGADAVALARAA